MAKPTTKTNKPAAKPAAPAPAAKESKKTVYPIFSTEDAIAAIATLEGDEKVDVSKKDIGAVIKALRIVSANALAEGKKLQYTSFFSATPSYRSSREANNVSTGEPMTVPEAMGVSVKAGKALKDAAAELDPKKYAPKN